MTKRLLSIVIAALMVMALVPMNAIAKAVPVVQKSETVPTLDEVLNAEGGSLTFVNDETYAWTVAEKGDAYWAKSGNSGVNSSVSSISTTVEIGEDGGSVSFDLFAHGESNSDSNDWDVCRFYVDGEQQFTYGHHSAAETYTADLVAGEHTLTWTYKKDSSLSSNDDCFYVKNVAVTGIVVDEPAGEPELIAGYYFESDDELEDFTILDVNGDGKTWERSTGYAEFTYEGTGKMINVYSASNGGPDDWLITPAFVVPAEGTVSFHAIRYSSNYEETLQAYIGTSPDPEEMVPLGDAFVVTMLNEEYSYDIPAEYVGQTMYFAIRHFDSYDKFYVFVDAIEIVGIPAAGPDEPVEPDYSTVFDFEEPLEGFGFVDADEDGHDWERVVDGDLAFEGDGFAMSASFIEEGRLALMPDNWMILPAVEVPYQATMTFYAKNGEENFEDVFQVYAGTEADIDAMEPISEVIKPVYEAYTEYTVDLKDYAGQTVYFAFRHFDSVNTSQIMVDYIVIDGEGAPEDPAVWQIDEVEFDGYEVPAIGDMVADILENLTVPENVNYHILDSAVYHGDEALDEEDVIEFNEMYLLVVTFEPEQGYTFVEDAAFLVNGDDELVDAENSAVVNKINVKIAVAFGMDLEPGATWTFDNDEEGWKFVDYDEDGHNWYWYSSEHALASDSYYSGALYPDNWAFTPALQVVDPENAYMTFYVAAYSASYPNEQFQVYAGGFGCSPDDMIAVSPEYVLTEDGPEELRAGTPYYRVLVDLTELGLAEGDYVYLAIRHFDCTDQWSLFVDDVDVYGLVIADIVEPDFVWDFENDPADDNWRFVDNDGDGNTWYWLAYGVNQSTGNFAFEGVGNLTSASYNGHVLNPDNWAITPAVVVTDPDNLMFTFWVCGQDASYCAEHFQAYAGPIYKPEAMTAVSAEAVITLTGYDEVTKTQTTWTQFVVDLTEAGYEEDDIVYFAIRHFNCSDMFRINVDYVGLNGAEPFDGLVPVDAIYVNDADLPPMEGEAAEDHLALTVPEGAPYEIDFETTRWFDEDAMTGFYGEFVAGTRYSLNVRVRVLDDFVFELDPERPAIFVNGVSAYVSSYVYVYEDGAVYSFYTIPFECEAAPYVEPTEEPEPTEVPAYEYGLIAGYYFETEDEVNAWTFIEAESGANWVWSYNNPGQYDYTELAHEGQGFIMSYSFIDYDGPYQADNWAVSPAIVVPAGDAALKFYANQANASYPESIDVYVGTSADTASMTLLQRVSPTTGYDDEWTLYEIDLSEYSGQTIYVAFHDTDYDCYEIWVDQVEIWGNVVTTQPTEEPVEPTDEPVEPTDEPVEPTAEPVEPAAPVWVPVTGEIEDGTYLLGTTYEGVTYVIRNQFYQSANGGIWYSTSFVAIMNENGEITGIDSDTYDTDNAEWEVTVIDGELMFLSPLANAYLHTPDSYEGDLNTTSIGSGQNSAWTYENGLMSVVVANGTTRYVCFYPSTGGYTNLFGAFQQSDENVPAVMTLYKLVEPTEPVQPTDEPVEPTDEPVEPTDEPVEPTDEPVEPTDEPVLNDLDAALNAPGNYLHFENDATYPWTVETEGDIVYAMSGNATVSSSTSAVTTTFTAPDGGSWLSFKFKAWGEGTSWDVCSVSIDGTVIFSKGAYDNEDWEEFRAFVAPGTHTLTFAYTKDSSVNPTGDYFAVDDVALEDANIVIPNVTLYGACVYDPNTTLANNWVTFSSSNTAEITTLAAIAEANNTFTAAYYNGVIYGVDRAFNLFSTTLEDLTAITTIAAVATQATPTSATFVNGVMYLVLATDSSSTLNTVDIATGALTEIGTLNVHLFGIAGTPDGVLYGIDGSGILYTVDPATAALTQVGATGVACSYVQDLTYDIGTGKLFWAQQDNNDGHLYMVEPETALAVDLGSMAGGVEIVGLFTTNTEPLPQPTDEPVQPTDEPVEPTDEPVEPTDEPVEPTDEPVLPTTATIVLNIPADVWGDGSGYQMLLDADATAYGTIIPETGGLTSSGDAPAGVYDEFEYKIPVNADGSLTTTNILVEGQISIEIPAGIYDWCITNPTPGDRLWIASAQGNIPGRYDNFEFIGGKTYTFTIAPHGSNDGVDLVVTNDGEEPVVYDLDYALNVQGGTLHFVDDATYPWVIIASWDGSQVYAKSGNGGVADSTSAISLTVNLVEAGTVSFDYKAFGEGSSTFWDHCDFAIDGEVMINEGASQQSEWVHVSYDLTAGEHTLTWSYTKDSSVNPTGDYFAVDNVVVTGLETPVEPTDAPVEPTDAPVEPTDAPVEPTAAPVEPGLLAGYYFETQAEVDAWTFIAAPSGVNWVWSYNNPGQYDYTELAHEGQGFIMSYSFIDYDGAYQADNWAVSPAVALPAGNASVTFYATQANASYPESIDVYVGTSADTSAMTMLQTVSPTTGYDDEWTRYEIDLSAYAGQTIYLAFHDSCYDMYEIWIDQVEFWGEGEPVTPTEPPVQPLCGDVNGDGAVDMNDSLLVMRYVQELITADQLNLDVADVNEDGQITLIDALLILRYSLGVITELPIH